MSNVLEALAGHPYLVAALIAGSNQPKADAGNCCFASGRRIIYQ